ncbi:hypothetical protein [Halorussus amylolyticus]|uniref:hypothetical protein n=1 Tax=Halorussus amylolyticus TaxID=1126242 RepID=UPI00104B27E0|nr:hypothetical protein [Halorussus amylolyticus]
MSEREHPKENRRSMLNSVHEGHSIFENDESVSSDRRPLLKGLAVSVGSLLGLGGTAAAGSDTEADEIRKQTEAAMEGYDTVEGVETAVANHENGLLNKLTDSSLVAAVDSDTFTANDVQLWKAPAENEPTDGTYVTASEREGTFAAQISIVRKTPNHIVRVNIEPQLDRSFATVSTREGETIAVLDPSHDGELSAQTGESTDDTVTPQKECGTDGYTCPPGACCLTCGTLQTKHERTCCVFSDGSTDCYEEAIDKCCDPLVCC